jgi:hypothetical protein
MAQFQGPTRLGLPGLITRVSTSHRGASARLPPVFDGCIAVTVSNEPSSGSLLSFVPVPSVTRALSLASCGCAGKRRMTLGGVLN